MEAAVRKKTQRTGHSLDGKCLSKAVRSFVRADQLITREADLLIASSLCLSQHSRVREVFFSEIGCNLFIHCAVRPPLLLRNSVLEHMMFSTFLYVLQPFLFRFTHSCSLQSMYIAIIFIVVFEIA